MSWQILRWELMNEEGWQRGGGWLRIVRNHGPAVSSRSDLGSG